MASVPAHGVPSDAQLQKAPEVVKRAVEIYKQAAHDQVRLRLPLTLTQAPRLTDSGGRAQRWVYSSERGCGMG